MSNSARRQAANERLRDAFDEPVTPPRADAPQESGSLSTTGSRRLRQGELTGRPSESESEDQPQPGCSFWRDRDPQEAHGSLGKKHGSLASAEPSLPPAVWDPVRGDGPAAGTRSRKTVVH
ncbi:unnamed protein product [Lampetra planeri]